MHYNAYGGYLEYIAVIQQFWGIGWITAFEKQWRSK
jgi:hypothetical protein